MNSNSITAFLPAGTNFTFGSNSVAVSLNAGLNWTTNSVTFTFQNPCPGGKLKKKNSFFLIFFLKFKYFFDFSIFFFQNVNNFF